MHKGDINHDDAVNVISLEQNFWTETSLRLNNFITIHLWIYMGSRLGIEAKGWQKK